MKLGLSCSSFSSLSDGKYMLNPDLWKKIKEGVAIRREERMEASIVWIKGSLMLKH